MAIEIAATALILLAGLRLTTLVGESGMSRHAETKAASERPLAMAVLAHTTHSGQPTRAAVGSDRARQQPIAPDRIFGTVASIRAAWIAGADAGAPDLVLNALEASLRFHPSRSPEAQLARRALDDLLALRDRRLGGGRRDSRDPPADHEAERRRQDEWIAGYAHTLRHDERPQAINDALRALSGIREEAAAEAIVAAGLLPEPTQRARRIHLLWRMAADGVGMNSGATIRDHLERAVWSSDPIESTLARHAVADLERLEIHSHR